MVNIKLMIEIILAVDGPVTVLQLIMCPGYSGQWLSGSCA